MFSARTHTYFPATMRCRQLLSLSVTLATVLVLVKCENAGNTPPAQEKDSVDHQEIKTAIDDHTTPVNASATVNETETATDSSTEKVKPTIDTTAHQTPQTPKDDVKDTTAPKKDGVTTAPEGDPTTIKPTVKAPTTTPKPQNSTSSALTALSAVTLCVLSLTVSL